MKVYVPFHGEVSIATRCALVETTYTPVALSDDPHDYARYFAARWAEGETFINVEHDVVPWPGAIEALLACSEPWCCYGYHQSCHRQTGIGIAGPLGCVKITAELIAATPGAWDEPCAWDYCDCRLRDVACPLGFRGHEHFPGVVNANSVLLR